MALSKKEKQKMSDGMMVAGSIRAAKEVYDMAKPVVKKVAKTIKKKIKARKQKRKYDNNTYTEGT